MTTPYTQLNSDLEQMAHRLGRRLMEYVSGELIRFESKLDKQLDEQDAILREHEERMHPEIFGHVDERPKQEPESVDWEDIKARKRANIAWTEELLSKPDPVTEKWRKQEPEAVVLTKEEELWADLQAARRQKLEAVDMLDWVYTLLIHRGWEPSYGVEKARVRRIKELIGI